MQTLIKRFLIIALVAFAGYWGVERFMAFVDARYEEREALARQVGEKKAEQITRTIEAGQAVRAEALREQLSPANALQNNAAPRPVSTQPLRQQLDAAGVAARGRAEGAGGVH